MIKCMMMISIKVLESSLNESLILKLMMDLGMKMKEITAMMGLVKKTMLTNGSKKMINRLTLNNE